mmetsp:Transcript_49593/g.53518  ORF Transcript_49593/g.53518 Transcript_49593/m.53518 type:complete len:135 (+) Transcript_49593:458-862(+)
MPHLSSKNNVLRQFQNLDINDTDDNRTGDSWKEDYKSSCPPLIAIRDNDIDKGRDCRPVMVGKRGSYSCKECNVPLKGHTCPHKKKSRYVKRDTSKVIDKKEIETQTTMEPSFLESQQINTVGEKNQNGKEVCC